MMESMDDIIASMASTEVDPSTTVERGMAKLSIGGSPIPAPAPPTSAFPSAALPMPIAPAHFCHYCGILRSNMEQVVDISDGADGPLVMPNTIRPKFNSWEWDIVFARGASPYVQLYDYETTEMHLGNVCVACAKILDKIKIFDCSRCKQETFYTDMGIGQTPMEDGDTLNYVNPAILSRLPSIFKNPDGSSCPGWVWCAMFKGEDEERYGICHVECYWCLACVDQRLKSKGF